MSRKLLGRFSEARRFIDPSSTDPDEKEEAAQKIAQWESAAASEADVFEMDGTEYSETSYRFDRHEATPDRPGREYIPPIDVLHGESFLSDIIPNMITQKKQIHPNAKVRILDIGGGAGIFADQIRKKFGDDVVVMTTGLRKKVATLERRMAPPVMDGEKLPNLYLYKRSIREFSDVEEFDLITDTIGEIRYGSETQLELYQYLSAVISKLRINGHASLVAGEKIGNLQPDEAREEVALIAEAFPNVSIVFEEMNPGGLVIKIDKHAANEEA